MQESADHTISREIAWINQKFGAFPPQEVLSWFLREYPGKIAFSTSLGAEDQVITEMLSTAGYPVRIFMLDTGRMFPETYELIDITEKRYGLKLEVWSPDSDQVRRMVYDYGINLFYESVEKRQLCCNIRKTNPLSRALAGNRMWITGLRREQSDNRTGLDLAGFDPVNGLIKLNPLFNWTTGQVWRYIREHNVPYNTLHDRGYPSIGCQPCTRAVVAGENIRAGRWWWEQNGKKECGLHE